ncbi:MAG: molybdopterin converting factor subunit 1 [Hyphomicrobiales bacterium]|nr:molybdopterin converting factor subunit 1 [Hyphomicrobiales bacterium]MDE2113595.1 molybdopterin converting factor subunit 1 [Hyphomicrobiales bacterium]
MKLVYFAWVRERIGLAEEERELPPELATIADVITWLRQQGEPYEHAFGGAGTIRAALDKTHAKPNAAIAGVREIAFFPPMTGG